MQLQGIIMTMRIMVFLIGVLFFSGCANTGYQPVYIISDTSKDAVHEEVTQPEELR
jgi:hypothetical protein